MAQANAQEVEDNVDRASKNAKNAGTEAQMKTAGTWTSKEKLGAPVPLWPNGTLVAVPSGEVRRTDLFYAHF